MSSSTKEEDSKEEVNENQSMAPHLNESLRRELVKYMQFGLRATVNVPIKDHCRNVRISYKKVEKTTRGSFKANVDTVEEMERTTRCTDCICTHCFWIVTLWVIVL